MAEVEQRSERRPDIGELAKSHFTVNFKLRDLMSGGKFGMT